MRDGGGGANKIDIIRPLKQSLIFFLAFFGVRVCFTTGKKIYAAEFLRFFISKMSHIPADPCKEPVFHLKIICGVCLTA